MTEMYTPQEIARTSTEDIARWDARLKLADLALGFNNKVSLGSMAGDSQLFWYLAENAEQGKDYRSDEEFENGIIYMLKAGLNYTGVIAEPDAPIHEYTGRDAGTGMWSSRIMKAALFEGLLRLGLRDAVGPDAPGETTVPVAAVAALCLKRADITQPEDRAIYERAAEITAISSGLKSVINLRKLQGTTTDRDGTARPISYPMYVQAPYLPRDSYDRFGLDPKNPLNAWWQELQLDLAKVDAAIDNL